MIYLTGMLAMGWWGMRCARSKSDFLVAGRRLSVRLRCPSRTPVPVG
ncbi:hypothetical protein OG757_29710 [Streptomyces sp. NBC_01262]|nr:hypothetical protein [Streptomyces sp. NBC_01262]